jgi:hypothetical protein
MFKLNTLFSRIMSIEPIRRQSIVSLIWQIAFTFVGFLSTIYFAHAVGAGVMGAFFLFLAYYSIINLMTGGHILLVTDSADHVAFTGVSFKWYRRMPKNGD